MNDAKKGHGRWAEWNSSLWNTCTSTELILGAIAATGGHVIGCVNLSEKNVILVLQNPIEA